MIPFTITDPSKRPLGAYLCRLASDGRADIFDPAAKTWTQLTTFGHQVIPASQLGTSDLYVGLIDETVLDTTHNHFVLACPAGGGDPLGSPAYVDATPPPINGQTVIVNVGRPF